MLPKVIIVDDDNAVRSSLRALFESHDFDVEDFGSGVPFLATFQDDDCSVLILDLQLPDLNGDEILSRLRQRMHVQVPVVIITAHAEPGLQQRLMDIGANAFMKKPFDAMALIEMTKTLHHGRAVIS